MATKSGGRLTFSGRQEYKAVPYVRHNTLIGYTAICQCTAGNHFLAEDNIGRIVERTANALTPIFVFVDFNAAQDAIEQWQRQHDAAQRASGETPQEG